MKKIIFVTFFVFTGTMLAQEEEQITIGFESNSQYYVDDEKTGDFTESERFRSNNYLKVDYFYSNFFVGFQAEGYAPNALLNYAPNLDETNIALYYAGYKSEKLEVTAGYFYEQYGSGLILRSWEDRQLGINNALRGAKVRFSLSENIGISALYGNQRNGFKVSDGSIYGLNSEINISSIFIKNYQIIPQNNYTIIHFHHQYIKILIFHILNNNY